MNYSFYPPCKYQSASHQMITCLVERGGGGMSSLGRGILDEPSVFLRRRLAVAGVVVGGSGVEGAGFGGGGEVGTGSSSCSCVCVCVYVPVRVSGFIIVPASHMLQPRFLT